jgi:hypothetical protein
LDHTSWDACWLRIDYNGHGLDAFVTDLNLSRARVSVDLTPFPAPEAWMHIALSWDENFGVKLYVNGEKKAELFRPGMYAAGLDQFGPHSRAISHWNVSSAYNFIRGGDIDEIAIFDRMLRDQDVAQLAQGQMPGALAPLCVAMDDPLYRAQWYLRCGFNRDEALRVMGKNTVVRKVEVGDAYDHKRWWWKGCDGIRETTWPGTFNRSRLTGRNDYFQLPDWDCYSVSGKTITFELPEEKWNHVELSGSAYGKMVRVDDENRDGALLFDRPQGMERTSHDVPEISAEKSVLPMSRSRSPLGTCRCFMFMKARPRRAAFGKDIVWFPVFARRMKRRRRCISILPAAMRPMSAMFTPACRRASRRLRCRRALRAAMRSTMSFCPIMPTTAAGWTVWKSFSPGACARAGRFRCAIRFCITAI